MIESKRFLKDGENRLRSATYGAATARERLLSGLFHRPPKPLVPKFHGVRRWATVAWCLVSGFFVQPAIAGYGKVPLFFVENRGQVDREVGYMGKGPRFSVYF